MRIAMGSFGAATGVDADHLRRHVEQCRNGEYGGLECLKVGVDAGVATPGDLGIGEGELEEFRQRGIVQPACRFAEEIVEGNFENLSELSRWAMLGFINADELPVTESQLQDLVAQHNLKEAEEIVAKSRAGEDYEGLGTLVEAAEAEQMDPEQFGTTIEELRELQEKGLFWRAGKVADECRDGEFENLPHLQQAIEEGMLDTVQVKELDLDLEAWERGFELQRAKLMLDQIRTDPSEPWPTLRTALIREFNRRELGLGRIEYRALVNPHPVRYRLAALLVKISRISRRLSWELRGVDPDNPPPVDLL